MDMNPTQLPEHDARHIDYPETYAAGTVVLVSGGVDSLINADEHPDARLLFVDMGHADAANERRALGYLFQDRELRVAAVAGIDGGRDGMFVPARNMLLACIAVHHGDDIVIGAMADDHSVDKTPEALAAMSRILTEQSGRPVNVRAPLLPYCKHEAVRMYVDGRGWRRAPSPATGCSTRGPATAQGPRAA
jgi:7-cyano-7-deazaguanine synthase in queuosine biosynthesis